MRDLDVGALPICGEDGKLKGMLTDRDIVVKTVAEGGDPGSTKARELAQGAPDAVSVDDPADELLHTMAEHQIRRVPVFNNGRFVGIGV